MGNTINNNGASSISHPQTAGADPQNSITKTVKVNGKLYNCSASKVWGLRVAREVLGVHGLVKPVYDHFHGKLHEHRADITANPSKLPSTPLSERTARPLPKLPNQMNEQPTTHSKPANTPLAVRNSSPEIQPAKDLTAPEIIKNLEHGKFEDKSGFSLNKFSEAVQQLSTEDIKPLMKQLSRKEGPGYDTVMQEVREIYAERKVTEGLKKFGDNVQGLKDQFAGHYAHVPKLAAAMLAEIDRQVGLQEAPDSRSLELKELTPSLQGVYDSGNGSQLEFGTFQGVSLKLDQEYPKRPDDRVINEQFKNIQNPDIRGEIHNDLAFRDQAIPKYKDIHQSDAGKAFAPGAPYHAAKVDLPGGSFIASQGPIEKTETNFIKMLAHHRPAVSVSLVNSTELQDPKISHKKENQRSIEVGPKTIGEEKNYDGVKVRLDGQYSFDKGNVTVKQFSINGETQFRVYDKSWEDHSAGNPERLAKLSVLVEKLRQHPSVASRSDNPTVVNCNAGVGRTGTFVTIDNSLRQYQKTGEVPKDFTQTINTARKVRNRFVQTAGQFNTVTAVHGQFTPLFNPLLKEAGLTVATPATPQKAPEPKDNGLKYGSEDYAVINREARDAARLRRANRDDTYVNTNFADKTKTSVEKAPDLPPVAAERTKYNGPKDADELLDKITAGGYGMTIQTFDKNKLTTELTHVLRQAHQNQDQEQFDEISKYTETLKADKNWSQIGLLIDRIVNNRTQNGPPPTPSRR
ncbi:tyrosine-protein phosphatase [Endozoicomonas sp. 8E]|uniref:tyrosine-protein phosphatase n=1 Tax=Endozoicomonas sp. 8E TaxID=3035692 RepID=UPI002938D4B9|nr:tyrosine-protein phosphatase [Endozoicomonas sp. 8E]WOG29725.1 tyrosine-protein phosphatase [Endozoicomonas sp. 8E]